MSYEENCFYSVSIGVPNVEEIATALLQLKDNPALFEGLVHLGQRKLTVGAVAKLAPDVIAGEVIVYGSVKGNVRGKRKIEIKKDGSVNEDLTTAQIIIEDGAYFKGSIEIERSAEKEDNKNVLSRTASSPAMPTTGAGPKSI